MNKRLLSFMLILVMMIGMMPSTAFAIESESLDLSDISNDWSKTALENAVNNGLLSGYGGEIMPKDPLTRAQMATMINRAFGTTEKVDLHNYTDVGENAWYYADMAKAVQMKTFIGYGGKLNPNSNITRQEAFVVIARAFKLSGAAASALDQFSDKDLISTWAKDGVASLALAGYVAGSNGKINPKQNITREEFAQLLDNILKNYIKTAGTYTSNLNGNVMINVPEVTLKDMTITGDLVIGDGVGNGEVTLDGVTVTGRTVIRGGGVNSIKIIGESNLQNIIIARVDGEIRVYTEDGTQIGEVTVDGSDDIIIEGHLGTVTVFASDVTVMATNADIAQATINGDRSIIMVGEKSTIKTAKIDGENAKLITQIGSKVDRIIANGEGAAISGTGTIGIVEANANDITVTTIGTKVIAEAGTTGVIAGTTPVASGNTEIVGGVPAVSPRSSGGGGSGGSSSVAVSGVTITGIAQVGVPLTAIVAPAGATVSYRWQICDTSGGTYIDISGAAINQYTPVTSEASMFIRVVATGTGSYTGTATSDVTAAVEPAAVFAGGDGSVGNPYQVANATHLNEVRNYLDKHFIQISDIDLNVAPWNSGVGWDPIGTAANQFIGSYDGQFFEIQNLFINRPAEDYIGLFCNLSGSLREMALVNVNITGRQYTGGLIGCTHSGSFTTRSYVTGQVTGTQYIGGLAGGTPGNTIQVDSCYANVTVRGDWGVGGLVGLMYGGISNSYATGNVVGNNNSRRIGGLVGEPYSNVINCYAVGNVSAGAGSSEIGGLLGGSSYGLTSSYYDTNTSGQVDTGKGAPKTSDEMKQHSTFIGWDFANLWEIDAAQNNGYPLFIWQ